MGATKRSAIIMMFLLLAAQPAVSRRDKPRPIQIEQRTRADGNHSGAKMNQLEDAAADGAADDRVGAVADDDPAARARIERRDLTTPAFGSTTYTWDFEADLGGLEEATGCFDIVCHYPQTAGSCPRDPRWLYSDGRSYLQQADGSGGLYLLDSYMANCRYGPGTIWTDKTHAFVIGSSTTVDFLMQSNPLQPADTPHLSIRECDGNEHSGPLVAGANGPLGWPLPAVSLSITEAMVGKHVYLQLEERTLHGQTSRDFVADNIVVTGAASFAPCGSTPIPTPAETPAPTPPPGTTSDGATATGDPHMENIHGERFDLMRPGSVLLISVPRGSVGEDALLVVEADARRLGGRCADIYFQKLNITGTWADKTQSGGLFFDVSKERESRARWNKIGPVELKVVHGHTNSGTRYLNFFIKHLGQTGFAVGGLLGEDDYTEAATPTPGCETTMALNARERSDGESRSESSVAVAS